MCFPKDLWHVPRNQTVVWVISLCRTEWSAARLKAKQNHTQCKEISNLILVRHFQEYFWRHVSRCPHEFGLQARSIALNFSRKTKVCHFQVKIFVNKDVLKLQILMSQSLPANVIDNIE